MHEPETERISLLHNGIKRTEDLSIKNGLSLLFTVICIVDVFGVFPIIALPKAIIDCGYIGAVIVISVCSLQIMTATLLGKCWIIAEEVFPNIYKKNRYPYSALAEITYGKAFSRIVTLFLDVTVFGGGIPNLIVASQNLQLLGLRVSDNNINVSFCYWIILLGAILCPILWLGSPKDMKLLCSISVSLVILVFLFVLISFLFTGVNNNQIINDIPHENLDWITFLKAYGIIAFQFDIHPTILTIQVDMKDKRKLSKAIVAAYSVSLGMFSLITVIAAVKYGKRTELSILETLPTSTALHLAAGLTAVQLCLTSAISNNALYQHIEDCLEIPREFNHRRCLLRTILTIFAIVMAESVPRFDIVMSLIGGAFTGPLIFIFPPLFYMRMLSLQRSHKNELMMETVVEICSAGENSPTNTKQFSNDFGAIPQTDIISTRYQDFYRHIKYFLCSIIILACISLTILTTYLNLITFIKYSNVSEPCIFNVSSALINL